MNLDLLRQRADLLDRTRAFFKTRGFLEVETPLAAREAIPERHIHLMRLADEPRWLQASPEMHHKRLLCAGSGPIFEVTRSFRGGERGDQHRPEFTILEWYRPGDDLHAGMDRLDELVQELLGAAAAKRTTYREAFVRTLGVDPHKTDAEALAAIAREAFPAASDWGEADRDTWLENLLSLAVEPTLGADAPEILYHYPETQSALATVVTDEAGARVAERFELYYRGVELANGYHELTDPVELERRLAEANRLRSEAGQSELPLPERLLAEMRDPGLPACAGVALGFDRLVMLATGVNTIADVRSFESD